MVLFTNAVDVAKAVPPVAAAYHCIWLPVATKLAIIAPVVWVCVAVAIGAVVFAIIGKAIRALLQLPALDCAK